MKGGWLKNPFQITFLSQILFNDLFETQNKKSLRQTKNIMLTCLGRFLEDSGLTRAPWSAIRYARCLRLWVSTWTSDKEPETLNATCKEKCAIWNFHSAHISSYALWTASMSNTSMPHNKEKDLSHLIFPEMGRECPCMNDSDLPLNWYEKSGYTQPKIGISWLNRDEWQVWWLQYVNT